MFAFRLSSPPRVLRFQDCLCPSVKRILCFVTDFLSCWNSLLDFTSREFGVTAKNKKLQLITGYPDLAAELFCGPNRHVR